MSKPSRVSIHDLVIGQQYYFKSIPYDRILYKGILENITKTRDEISSITFKDVQSRNAFDKDGPTFKPYSNPNYRDHTKITHTVGPWSQYKFEYFTASADKIIADSIDKVLETNYKESVNQQHSEVEKLIKSYSGVASYERKGGKSKRRNRKSRRKTKSRK
jgi:hypothetical protein